MSRSVVSDDELQKALGEERQPAPKKSSDEKQRWISRMIRSAKHQHKICPYYDKKTQMCFLALGSKCDRDGRFENCPRFREFLEKKYEEYKKKNKPLPLDFSDIVLSVF